MAGKTKNQAQQEDQQGSAGSVGSAGSQGGGSGSEKTPAPSPAASSASASGTTSGADLTFSKNEKVLCADASGLFYPAKILDINFDRKSRTSKPESEPFKVHYDGWNKRHDEWVTPSRILKSTPQNEEKSKLAREEKDRERSGGGKEKKRKTGEPSTTGGKGKGGKEEKSGSRASTPSLSDSKQTKSRAPSVASASGTNTPTPTTSVTEKTEKTGGAASGGGRGAAGSRKRPFPDPHTVESKEEYTQRPEINIQIPSELKSALVDDWDMVTRQMKVVALSKGPTVDELIEEYKGWKKMQKNMTVNKLSQHVETALGIRDHFNVMLGAQLLYKLERPQYQDFTNEEKGKPASERYGFIHLLRLFVRIGTLLAYTSWTPKNIQLITSHLHDFLTFMKHKKGVYFGDIQSIYETTAPEYQKRAWL